jgi:type I restriction enzyme, S subunit
MSSDLDWKTLTLKAAGVSLIDCDHRTPAAAVEGYPYIAIPQLKDGQISLDGVRRITAEDYAEWTRKLAPQENDVIVVRRCNSGQSAHVPAGLKCAIGQNLVVLRADGKSVLPEYLRWLVRGEEWWSEVGKYINVGAVFDSLRCRDIPNFELPIPPLDAQREISQVLGAIDDRITLLRETNTTLEAIAQALFKSWFVDFDPIHAKMQGRAPEGMDEATAALFPDSFEESELGPVPKGWSLCPVYDLATFINGAAYKAFEPNAERRGLPIIKIAELKSGVSATTAFSAVDMPEKYLIESGDILFSWSGNPDTSIDTYVWPHEAAWLNQHIFRVLPNKYAERAFVLQTLRYLRPVFAELARNKQTTGLGHVTVADLKRLLVVKPDSKGLDLFNRIAGPVQQRIFENERQAISLASLRDTLLPRLISGQLQLLQLPEASVQLMEALQ